MHASEFTPEFVERFWSQVAIGTADACWPWQGPIGTHGYGMPGPYGLLAHRVAWELTHGPIPKGKVICHTCDNRPCCNPAHHFLGSHRDNAMDKARKGRAPAKLNATKVQAMRVRYAAGGVSTRELAREYGVDRRAVVFALRGMTWAHVGGPVAAELDAGARGNSGYRGVDQRHDGLCWRSRIHLQRQEILLGCFPTPEGAARAYDKAAKELFGDSARLNFPDE